MIMAGMSRAALGQAAALGDLYDARTDNFCGSSIFKGKIPEEALTLTDSHFSDIQLIPSDSLAEKFSKFDVQAELQLSILSGLVSLDGSSRYLLDQKNSARTVRRSLLYNIRTTEEDVNIYHEDLKEAFALEAIESGIATHVVVGITWGANSVLSFEYQKTDDKDVNDIEHCLTVQLDNIASSISGKAEVENKNNNNVNFDIHTFGDILPQNQNLPKIFEESLQLMKEIPNLIAASNEGRGKPLSYHLIPLSQLKNYLHFTINAESETMVEFKKESLASAVQLFERISLCRQKLNDIYKDAIDHKFCVRPEDFAQIASSKKEFAIQETELRSKLATTLPDVRSGKSELSTLEVLIQEYLSGEFSPDGLAIPFNTWDYITEKIAFAKSLSATGATYIGFDKSLDEEVLKNLDAKTFILFFKEQAKTDDIDVWKKNCQLFFQEVKKSVECKYFAVDCDFHPQLWPVNGLCIQVVQQGKLIVENLLLVQEHIPLARCTSKLQRVFTKPNSSANLFIACTGNKCKPYVKYEWFCGKCKGNIEYGFDSYFYCMCGRGPTAMFEFKCTDSAHGMNFEKHDGNTCLESLLSRLRPLKELNILILGETGVGKSTWINGFVNYLSNESLQEAEASELRTLIPTEFTVLDENFDEITISTGTDINEIQKAGQSATQECKVYPFVLGDRKIRLIDTPGIGDTRGITQDKVNFQNILSTISYLDDLHGICILLKPNNARLTVMFRFCIKELLTYLHRDASRNIIFCFTNTRGTFFQPGDTMPALKSLLRENPDVVIPICHETIYCFDSEAYRFLAVIQNKRCPVKFADRKRESVVESWEKSFSETKRMLRHISGLRPHTIKSTLNLNHAREIIVKLTKPLAEVSKKIQKVTEVIEDEKRDILRTKADFNELEKKKKLTRPDIKIIPLPYPRTVCCHIKCKKFYGTDAEKRIKYISLCHNPCGLTGITSDTIGHEGLMHCYAMNNGWCIVCSHHYKEHQHIYFETEDITVEVEDEGIKELMMKCKTASELKEQMIEAKNKEVEEYNLELKEIEKSSVKFACFLKINAITPYNDAMIDYMNHLISEEESKVGVGGSDKTLKSLKESKASYEYQIKILDNEMAKSTDGGKSGILKPEAVGDLVNHLKKLKYTGGNIEEALAAVDGTHQKMSVYSEYVSPYVKPTKKRKKEKKRWFNFWS